MDKGQELPAERFTHRFQLHKPRSWVHRRPPSDVTTEPSLVNEVSRSSELLTGSEVAERMNTIMETLDMETACSFIHPTNVLTLAGLKGHTYIYSAVANENTSDQVAQLNSIFSAQGLRIRLRKVPDEFGLTAGGIDNLAGFEYKSKRSSIILPKIGVMPFNAAAGFDGFKSWNNELYEKIREAIKNGILPSNEATEQIYEEGIRLGYPDQAVIDFETAIATGDRSNLVESMLLSDHPAAQRYDGATPDFSYSYESAYDHEIVENIHNGRKIIKEFYDTEWFKLLEQKADFQNAYQRHHKTHAQLVAARWAKQDNVQNATEGNG